MPAAIIQLFVAVAIVALVGCGGPPRPPERPTFERVAVNQRGVGIPYGAVVLFKADRELVALRVVEAPKWGYWIEYEWNAAPVAEGVFETTSTGAGETNEQKRRSAVIAGPVPQCDRARTTPYEPQASACAVSNAAWRLRKPRRRAG